MIFDTKLGVDIDAGRLPGPAVVAVESAASGSAAAGPVHRLRDPDGAVLPARPAAARAGLADRAALAGRCWSRSGSSGMVKLARALRIGSDGSRLLAGAVFVLWPTFTIVIGSTSAAALPGLVVPWAVLPAGPGRGGPHARPGGGPVRPRGRGDGRRQRGRPRSPCCSCRPCTSLRTPRPAADHARPGLGAPRSSRRPPGGSIPLLLQGRYSFNFLPYIEQSAPPPGPCRRPRSCAAPATGPPISTSAAPRGCRRAGPWSPRRPAILASAAVAAAGLPGSPAGTCPNGAGSSASAWPRGGAGRATTARSAGPARARSITLFDGDAGPAAQPLQARAGARGRAGARLRARAATGARGSACRGGRSGDGARRHRAPLGGRAGPVGLALPQLSGQVLQAGLVHQRARLLVPDGRLTSPPTPPGPDRAGRAGRPARALHLGRHRSTTRSSRWPRSPWVERGLVPYGGPGSQVFLDTAEQAVESGQEVPGLPAYLDRAGIRYVVVRNDLAPASSATATAGRERDAGTVRLPPGRSVRAADRRGTRPPGPGRPGPASRPQYPAVEMFQAAARPLRPASPVAALPVSATVLVNGGPDSLLQLAGQGSRPASPP